MNNGRPNYQQNPMQGQQPGQQMPPQGFAPQGGYPPQEYYPQQGGFPPQGQPYRPPMQPQQMPPQGGYAPQGQRGYYEQPGMNRPYPPQGQPGGYYPQGMPQQSVPGYQQPLQPQPPQYPPQSYGVPGYPGPGGYPAGGQQPARQPAKKGFPLELAVKIAVFGVLPLLFVLGVVLSIPLLKWAFVALAVAGVAFLWARPVMSSSSRLTLTAVYAALVVVAVVSTLMGTPTDQRNAAGGNQSTQQPTGTSLTDGMLGSIPETLTMQEVTPSPEPAAESDESVYQLMSFFHLWKVNKTSELLTLCAPSWQNSVEEPLKALFSILANRLPVEYEVEKISGSFNDSTRTATVMAMIDKQNGKAPIKYRISVIMLKENGIWYVDPKSLNSNEPLETPTPTPTPEPTPTPVVSDSMTLYYNPDGGSYYHADPNCRNIDKKYKPLQGTFKYSQLNKDSFAKLKTCPYCNAPARK